MLSVHTLGAPQFRLLARHKHVRRLVRRLHLRGALAAHDRRDLQHIVFSVQHRDGHGVLAAVARILIGVLHQVDQLRIEVGPRRRLVHDQMADALDACAPEKVRALRVEHKMGAAVEEHVARACHFAVLVIIKWVFYYK